MIELEIPTDALPRIAERHAGVIADLYDLGVGFVLDGIGADVIDPTLLTWLPATTWKFHRAVIARLPQDRAAAALIETLVDAARAQGILTVAVGVEREEQRAALESLRCDALAGIPVRRTACPRRVRGAARGTRRAPANPRLTAAPIVIGCGDALRPVHPSRLSAARGRARIILSGRRGWSRSSII